MRWSGLAVGGVLLFLLVGTSYAKDASTCAQQIKSALETKNVELALGAVRAVGDKARTELIKSPRHVKSVAESAERHMKSIAKNAGEKRRKDVDTLCAWFVQLTADAQKRHPLEDGLRVAHAHSARASIDASTAFEEDVAVDAYRALAKAWRDAARLSAKRSVGHFNKSRNALRDSTVGTSVPMPEHYASLYASLVATAKDSNPDRDAKIELGQVAAIYSSFLLQKKKNKGLAREVVSTVLPIVASIRDKRSSYYRCACMAYNALLVNGYAAGHKRIGEFRCEQKRGRWGRLSFDVPIGWELEYGRRDDTQLLNKLIGQGVRGLTTIEIYRYRRDTEYTRRDGTGVGGDNPTGLADRDRESIRGYLDKITRERKRVAGRLNKSIRKSVGYELAGERSGRPRWYRSWYFRGEVRRDTYLVAVDKFYGLLRIDAALEHVLNSIRELPKSEEK